MFPSEISATSFKLLNVSKNMVPNDIRRLNKHYLGVKERQPDIDIYRCYDRHYRPQNSVLMIFSDPAVSKAWVGTMADTCQYRSIRVEKATKQDFDELNNCQRFLTPSERGKTLLITNLSMYTKRFQLQQALEDFQLTLNVRRQLERFEDREHGTSALQRNDSWFARFESEAEMKRAYRKIHKSYWSPNAYGSAHLLNANMMY